MKPENFHNHQSSNDNYHNNFHAWSETLSHGENIDEPRKRATKEAYSSYLEQDEPNHPWQSLVKRQLNPNLVGILSALGFAATLFFDIAHNGPSSFVVNNPEAATTAIAAGAAAIGTIANKIVNKANADELKAARQREREQRKERDNQW